MQKQTNFVLVLLLCFFAQLGLGQAFIPEKSAVTFRIKNAGFWVNGSFSDFDMQPQFQEQGLENGQLSGTLFLKSIDTNNKKRDEHLLSEDYFDAEQFPSIQLTSNRIEKKGTDYVWKGQLKIKATEKPVQIPFSVEEKKDHFLLQGELTINRIDYNVGGKSWLMNQKVYIQLQCAIAK